MDNVGRAQGKGPDKCGVHAHDVLDEVGCDGAAIDQAHAPPISDPCIMVCVDWQERGVCVSRLRSVQDFVVYSSFTCPREV